MGTWIRGRCLGRGAFGTVHLAFDRRSGRVFAVKSVDTGSCLPSQIEALENEIRILRSLSSPYVVEYLGDDVSGDAASTSCRNLHMEYLSGGTVVDEAGRRGGKFSGEDEWVVRSRVRCIVNALRDVHLNDVVHCDVKGRNVLVGGDRVVAKLADFGSAIRVEDVDRSRIVPRGSPLWMAPEVVRGEWLGPKSDVWSLGCTVIEMVTGKPAWEDEGVDTLSRIGYSSELPKFPSQLSKLGYDFLEKCLRRDYAERWSCDQLLQHPFLVAKESPDSDFAMGLGCSPRYVLDWADSDFEEEEEEEEQVSSNHSHEYFKAAEGRDVIGELSSSSGVNWESDCSGSAWITVRNWSCNTQAADKAARAEPVGARTGPSLRICDLPGAEAEIGPSDVDEDNTMSGRPGFGLGGGSSSGSGSGSWCGAGPSWRRGLQKHNLAVKGETETAMLNCLLKIFASNILVPDYRYHMLLTRVAPSFDVKFHACEPVSMKRLLVSVCCCRS